MSFYTNKNAYGLAIMTLLASVLLAYLIGAVTISPITALTVLVKQVPYFGNNIEVYWTSATESILLDVRLPRILTALLVGGSLSVAGACFQGLLRNPLADPYILGVSSGAAVGAALSLSVFGTVISLLNRTAVAAFLGATIAVFLVIKIAQSARRLDVYTLILAGVVVGSFMNAVLSLLLVRMYNNMHQVIFWLMGNLGKLSWNEIAWFALVIIVVIIILLGLARTLNVMALGDTTAMSLGVSVEKIKMAILLLASFLTALAVAMAGTIGFVGLVVPHIIRLLTGPDHRTLIPLSALGGGVFLLWADTLARSIIAPVEIPVGVITAFIGAPFFAFLLKKRKSYLQ